MTVVPVLLLLAALIGVVELLRSHGESLSPWGVLILAIALLIDKGIV